MKRILILDTYYPGFLRSLHLDPSNPYESQLEEVFRESFGTADFYSRNLRTLGWEVMDVIVNCDALQYRWAREHGYPSDILAAQIDQFKPDVIFLQDLNIQLPKTDAFIAGQCSCPMPTEENLRRCNLIFSSFPHYIDRFERMGIQAAYNPLAFDPVVLDRVGPVGGRLWDCVFVGGVGNPSHWRAGMETLEAVARAIPSFRWWGYGVETLPQSSALRDKYVGEAWGIDMYRIFLQSKIVLNRHGEVAQGNSNNMRMFEATGCGALLLTERHLNLGNFFNWNEVFAYGSPDEAVFHIQRQLRSPEERNMIAKNGQARTLRDHRYAQRMKIVSETLTGMLCPA